MNVLCVGDVVGKRGCGFLRKHLQRLQVKENIDLTIVNGENSAERNGISLFSAEHIFASGADIITTGNHAFHRRESHALFDENPYLLRPHNFPKSAPGTGICIYKFNSTPVVVLNIMGTVYLESLRSPFEVADEMLSSIEEKIIIVDFHAEATAEKECLSFYLDGRISAFFGTHTHVQTADERILSNGTGYITDVGMVGIQNSVLGVKTENALRRMKDKMPEKFEQACEGDCKLNAIIFTIDESTGKTTSLKRININ